MSTGRFAGSLLLLTSAAFAQRAPESVLARIPDDLSISVELIHCSNRGRYDARSSLVWSADGSQVAYAGRRGDYDWLPVVGSKVGTAYAYVSRPFLAGGHAFFHCADMVTESTQHSWLWIDGKAIGPEDWMGDIGVSADGKRVAFWTHPGAKVGNAVAATSTTHLLAIAREVAAGRWSISRGEKWSETALVAPLFNASGEKVMTCAIAGGKGWVLLETGKREKELSEVLPMIDSFAMSRDGSAVAFVKTKRREAGDSVILSARDGAELYFRGKRVGKKHAVVEMPAVDAAGEHVAYVVSIDGKRTVAIDEEKEPAGRYDHVLELAFDPASKRLAFVANVGGAMSSDVPGDIEGGQWFVVVRSVAGGTELEVGAPYAEIQDLTWSASGTRLAYCACEKPAWRVICGTKQSEPHDEVGPPNFSADERSIGHGSRDGRELWWRVLALE